MAIDIQPYHKKGYLCIDDIIVSVADYFEKRHIFMHTKGLNFTYSPKIVKGEGVLKRIRTSCNYPTNIKDFLTELNYLQDFVGLHIDFISSLPKLELINYIEDSIEKNHPVAIISNTYYVPWHDQYYKKVNKLHAFLVIDIDINQKYLLCIDGYLSDKPVKLPFEDLLLYTDILIFKSINSKKNLSLPNILSQITNGLTDNHKLDNCDCIRLFAEDVTNITFLETEKQRYRDLDHSDFMIGLKSIEFGRKNLGDLFYYLSDIFIEYRDIMLLIQSKIESITEQWRLVIVFFVKGFYSDQTTYYMKKAAEQLLDIANNEEDVTRCILSLVHKSSYKIEK
ncbi:hypothetical protein AN1V17_06110 [Vallitalea sediminicola]